MRADDLVVHLARFAGALRERGVDVGIGDEVDATNALMLIDLFDRDEVRRAFLIAFKIRPGDRAAFDAMFDAFWTVRRAASLPAVALARAGPVPGRLRTAAMPGGRAAGEVHAALRHDDERRPAESGHPGYTPEEILRRKPFEECSDRDLAEMERLLARLTPRWAARRSRRLKPVRGRRGVPDLRRSLRRAVATGGEMVSLAHRARPLDQPRVVVLCDTSGSMDVHVRFLLAFVLALKAVAKKTEVFAFNTSLTRLTPWLSPGRITQTIERIAVDLPDWSGGTRIGDSLMEFAASYLGQVVSSRSVVVILSDGLDRGDTSMVTVAMQAIRAKAHRIVWLNPLAGDPRYEPTARAMAAALPFIDRLAPAHNLASLERLVPELAAV